MISTIKLFKKVLVSIFLIIFLLSVFPFVNQLKKILNTPFGEKDKNNKGISANDYIVQDILESMNSDVFAESDSYGCFNYLFNGAPGNNPCNSSNTVINACTAEASSFDIKYRANGDSYYPVTGLTISQTSGPSNILSPNPTILNISPTLSHLFSKTITAPAVSAQEKTRNYSFNLNFRSRDSDGTLNLKVDHKNTAPISNAYGPSTYSFNKNIVTPPVNLNVNAKFSDSENNKLKVTFQLSDISNFSNILQTQIYNSVNAGSVVNHTFSNLHNLNNGTYYWRAIAKEENALGTCVGFPNFDPPILIDGVSPVGQINITSSTTGPVPAITAQNPAIQTGNSAYEIPVSAKFSDSDTAKLNITFELSKDPAFNTIVDSKTFNDVNSGTLVNHTFMVTDNSNYYWRAVATDGNTSASTNPKAITFVPTLVESGQNFTHSLYTGLFLLGSVLILNITKIIRIIRKL